MSVGYDRDRLIALLKRDALRTGTFTLASGRSSHYYVDGRKVTLSAEGSAVIAAGAFYDLDAPVKRMGAMHVPIPFAPTLEDATVPTEQSVFEAARAMCG